MQGAEALVQARLARWPIAGVEIDTERPADFWQHGKAWIFRLSVDRDEAGTADLRCCYRLPTFVHAPSYEAGWPVFERAMEFEPALLALCAPEVVIRFDGERVEQWDV